jgi:antitoxin component YwqK of YwqJK toxin-antitoxin module
MKKYFVLVVSICFLMSCNGRIKKEVVEKYTNGNPKVEKHYMINNGVKELVKEIAYYDDKKPYMEGEYKNDKRNGKWTSWYQNGKKWSEGYFKEGLSDSIRITYYENGNKFYEGYYKNGIKTGIWKFWLENGKPDKVIDMSATPAP